MGFRYTTFKLGEKPSQIQYSLGGSNYLISVIFPKKRKWGTPIPAKRGKTGIMEDGTLQCRSSEWGLRSWN